MTSSEDDLSWVDSYWPIPVETKPYGARPIASRIGSMVLVHRLTNTPSVNVVDTVSAMRPEAAPLLSRWAEAWERAFDVPPAHLPPESVRHQTFLSAAVLNERDLLDRKSVEAAAGHRYALAVHGSEHRDSRLHAIDDAAAFLSFRHIRPHEGYIAIDGDDWYELCGHHEDGMPIFKSVESPRAKDLMRHRHTAYWTSAAFAEASLRTTSTARSTRATAMVLAAMARAGHAKAFVKAMSSKMGTWTIDLHGVTTPVEAAMRHVEAVFPSLLDVHTLIQEHVPFTHEQRFFVLDGRIVASVCSDRNLSQMEAGRRRLDERVAIIVQPSGAPGAYDRGLTEHVVDRRMAASFARVARRTVRAMRTDGFFDYVLDVGLTGRGVAAIEVNELHLSGPYALDHDRFALAHRRSADTNRQLIGDMVADMARRLGVDDHAHTVVEDLVGTASPITMLRTVASSRWHDRETEETVASDLLDVVARHIAENRERYGVGRPPMPVASDFVTWDDTELAQLLNITGGVAPLFRVPFHTYSAVGGWKSAPETIRPLRSHYVGWLTDANELRIHRGPTTSPGGVVLVPAVEMDLSLALVAEHRPSIEGVFLRSLIPGIEYKLSHMRPETSLFLTLVTKGLEAPVLRTSLRNKEGHKAEIDVPLPPACTGGLTVHTGNKQVEQAA